MKRWLADLPTTAAVTVSGIALAFGTGLALLGAMALGREVQEGALGLWLAFVAAMLGVGYAQFAKKRDTYTPSPPNPPDVEDVRADPAPTPARSVAALYEKAGVTPPPRPSIVGRDPVLPSKHDDERGDDA